MRSIKKINYSRYGILILFVACFLFGSCSSTKETTSETPQHKSLPPPADLQEWQDKQDEMEEARESSGLSQADIKKLDEYAEQKVALTCQMISISNQEQQSMSELESSEAKAQLNALDEQMTPLNQEITNYCDTPRKREYFEQIFKHKLKRCQ